MPRPVFSSRCTSVARRGSRRNTRSMPRDGRRRDSVRTWAEPPGAAARCRADACLAETCSMRRLSCRGVPPAERRRDQKQGQAAHRADEQRDPADRIVEQGEHRSDRLDQRAVEPEILGPRQKSRPDAARLEGAAQLAVGAFALDTG